jgi:hypothetical protein
MARFDARFARLELKFLIDELEAARIRSEISPYCAPDVHSRAPAPNRVGGAGYPISSLYLDTPGLSFHQAKERGNPNRIKLRVRTYSATSPAALEIKRRRSDVIDKMRGVIHRSQVAEAACGLVHDSKAARFFNDFAIVVAASGAGPTLTVRYEREAYDSIGDEYARITFDRRIKVHRTRDWDLTPELAGWYSFDDHWRTGHSTTPVVLEIKCPPAHLPHWVIALIRDHGLRRTSFSKYSMGVHLLQWHDGLRAERSRSAGGPGRHRSSPAPLGACACQGDSGALGSANLVLERHVLR